MFDFDESTQSDTATTPAKLCPKCGCKLNCSMENFSLGADGGGGIMGSLFHPEYVVDLYSCPECGKVELYTAAFDPDRKRKEEEADYVTCPACETRHSPLIGCPRCALHGRTSPLSAPKQEKEKKAPWEKKGRKMPWER